jgi:hypothetical protein
MDREDAVAVPWMASHTRNLRPERIVWVQDDVTHPRFYWLAVDEPAGRRRMVVERDGQTIRIIEDGGAESLRIRLDDLMLDLDQDVIVEHGGRELFRGHVPRTLSTLRTTLGERGDPRGIFSAEVVVTIPQESD